MNIPERVIRDILDLAVWAPSGDNSQPWRFEVSGNKIGICNIPERDRALYNFRQRGSFIAHGALMENIKIIASKLGYDTTINFFPDKNFTAVVTLQEKLPVEEPLYHCIKKRATNRRPYKKNPLSDEEKNTFINSVKSLEGFDLFLAEDAEQKKQLGKHLSLNEQVLFENPTLHTSFFGQIVWTDKEEKEKRKGLYLKTLELPPPARLAFHLFRNWKWLAFLNKIGLSRMVAKTNAGIYASSSAIGAILMPEETDENFIRAGMAMQKIWLNAVNMGLNMQILAGLVYLAQRVMANEAEMFSEIHRQAIGDAYGRIVSLTGDQDAKIAMFFRIGRGRGPSATSSRLPAEIVFI